MAVQGPQCAEFVIPINNLQPLSKLCEPQLLAHALSFLLLSDKQDSEGSLPSKGLYWHLTTPAKASTEEASWGKVHLRRTLYNFHPCRTEGQSLGHRISMHGTRYACSLHPMPATLRGEEVKRETWTVHLCAHKDFFLFGKNQPHNWTSGFHF